MVGWACERLLVASSGLGRLALELPAARLSGWLSNEASTGRGPVTAWLERGAQHLHQECPSWRSTRSRGGLHDRDRRNRSAQDDTHGGRDRQRRTSDRTTRGAGGPLPDAAVVGVGRTAGR